MFGRILSQVRRSYHSSAQKVCSSAEEAVSVVKSGDVLLGGGFGLCGLPNTLFAALAARGREVSGLTGVSNNAGAGGRTVGMGALLVNDQLSKLIASYLGTNKVLEQMYLTGKIDLELTPQGTLAERIRAGAAGIPAFYTPTGCNTPVEHGSVPMRNDVQGNPVLYPSRREARLFGGKKYIMEQAIEGDIAFIRAWKVDEAGNAIFRYTANNFAGAMARNAKITIVEAEEIVPTGSLDPKDVHLPGIFVDSIIQATTKPEIEFKTLRPTSAPSLVSNSATAATEAAQVKREMIARRAAMELQDGFYVNLGIGIPTLVPSFLPNGRHVWLQSENGILGMGPLPTEAEVDADIINAGKETVTLLPGASTFDSVESFGMIRGGHIDVSVLGAMEVSSAGDLANWIIPGKLVKGMGGAMDLTSCPDKTKIIVVTDHCDKKGRSKIVEQCSLPLTSARCVSLIITDLAVFDIDREQGIMTLKELMPGITLAEFVGRTALTRAKKGLLKSTSSDQLLRLALQKSIDSSGIDPSLVEDVIIGTCHPPSPCYEARAAALAAGLPVTTPVQTVNRLCGSGLMAIRHISDSIRAGDISIGLAAGYESMSAHARPTPHFMDDKITATPAAVDCAKPMGWTSEMLALEFDISRSKQDEYGLLSHRRASAAQLEGRFKDEIMPITTTVLDDGGQQLQIIVDQDDGIRHDLTSGKMAEARAAFRGVGDERSTGPNSSQVTDGAAVALLMRRSRAEELGFEAIATHLGTSVVGVEPKVMGMGPVPAIRAVLSRVGLRIEDVDLFEVNEAFGSIYAYCIEALGLPLDKVNVNGGAIALGHPLGATGVRQLVTGIKELRRREKGERQILCTSMCIGSGMGAAAVFVTGV
ncbi:uncharacterized protein I303_106935 [Kwoniella dejecticola CBS 10117]|uniref:3-oxoacid CoA-transferase n=1 Tax=Kwoniella dejecticola CBS 10117 TaxID=1296121 RepID=A0A1A5ZTA3_9TREE|nr:uncharacterized protein I303_08426 [Kwoniella dejecticola CBS 10117]OBR81044.1 hypothetical protein I303_08426 [Kwoniella dejecticola CBS 10117]